MTGFETATLGFYTMQSMIGLAQCLLIWMGLRQMGHSSELREEKEPGGMRRSLKITPRP